MSSQPKSIVKVVYLGSNAVRITTTTLVIPHQFNPEYPVQRTFTNQCTNNSSQNADRPCSIRSIRSIHHYIDTIDSLLNLKEGSFAKIENENYKKYVIKCLIDGHPIKLYVDSIVRDYHEDRKDGDLPIKYVVKLKYFHHEYAYTTFTEMIIRGYHAMINNWRKKSSLFPLEFKSSNSKYYSQVYGRNLHIIHNIGGEYASEFIKCLKTWFKVHCSSMSASGNWCPQKIADIGFGAAFPLNAMITHFEPCYVYALELNKARWTSFQHHCKQCIVQKNGTFDPQTMAFKVPPSGRLHIVTDNRDIKSFCEERCEPKKHRNQLRISHMTKVEEIKMPKLERPSSSSNDSDSVLIQNEYDSKSRWKKSKSMNFMAISHDKVTQFCSINCHQNKNKKKSKRNKRRNNNIPNEQCPDSFDVLDFTIIYDVAEYINDPDLQFIVDDMAHWTVFMYFAAPVEEEYVMMDDEDKFQDKWAIHRSTREYQAMLSRKWRCVGNSIWESKVLHTQSAVGNENDQSWNVRAKLLKMWFGQNRRDSHWSPSSIAIAHVDKQGKHALNAMIDWLSPSLVYVMESEGPYVCKFKNDAIDSVHDYNRWVDDDEDGSYKARGERVHIPSQYRWKPFRVTIDRRDIRTVCQERKRLKKDSGENKVDLVRLEHPKVTQICTRQGMHEPPVNIVDLLILHHERTFETMEEMNCVLNEIASWTRYLYVAGLVVKEKGIIKGSAHGMKKRGNVMQTDWQVKAHNWRKVGNGIWESKRVHCHSQIWNQLAHDC